MNHGLQIPFIIEIVFKDAKAILYELEKGKKLKDVLFVGNTSYFKNIRILCEVLSMKESIDCANVLDKNTTGTFQKLIKNNIYPIFIFLFSFFMIVFFSKNIVPSMQLYATSSSSFLFLHILRISFEIVIGLSLFFLLYCFLLKRNHKHMSIPIMRQYNTIQFAIVLKALLEKGLSTRNCMDVMEKMKQKDSIYRLAQELNKGFQKGMSMEETIKISKCFDPDFLKFITIGLQNSSLCSMLDVYIEKEQQNLQTFFRKTGIAIQIVSYISVGLLVIVVYEIMLYPLNMLTSF